MDVKEVGLEVIDLIFLSRNRNGRRLFFKMELNLQISHSSRCLFLAEEILKFSRSVLSQDVGLVSGIRLYLHRVC